MLKFTLKYPTFALTCLVHLDHPQGAYTGPG